MDYPSYGSALQSQFRFGNIYYLCCSDVHAAFDTSLEAALLLSFIKKFELMYLTGAELALYSSNNDISVLAHYVMACRASLSSPLQHYVFTLLILFGLNQMYSLARELTYDKGYTI